MLAEACEFPRQACCPGATRWAIVSRSAQPERSPLPARSPAARQLNLWNSGNGSRVSSGKGVGVAGREISSPRRLRLLDSDWHDQRALVERLAVEMELGTWKVEPAVPWYLDRRCRIAQEGVQ